MAALAIVVAVIALSLSIIGVLGAIAWSRSREEYRRLAERIDVDARLEYLTLQALSKMRDAARERIRDDRQPY